MSEQVPNVQQDQDFRTAMSNFPTGVTIVTALDEDGLPAGATVSAFSSVSLSPRLVLVCLKADTRSSLAVSSSKVFSVHILEDNQGDLAMRFALNGASKFEETPYEILEGRPHLTECRLRLDCELYGEAPGGDHQVFVGLVTNVDLPEDFRPLIHSQRRFAYINES